MKNKAAGILQKIDPRKLKPQKSDGQSAAESVGKSAAGGAGSASQSAAASRTVRHIGPLPLDQRLIFGVASGVLVLLLVLVPVLVLKQQKAYVPENNVDTVNMERSQVYLTGTGYQIDKKLEEDNMDLEDAADVEQPKQTPAPQTKHTPPVTNTRPYTTPSWRTRTSTSNTRRNYTSSSSSSSSSKTKKQKPPTIKTAVKDGKTLEDSAYSFWVTVTDYKGYNIPESTNGTAKFTVSCNGSELDSTQVSGSRTWFKATLKSGKNTITIKAWDSYGKKTTLTRTVTYKKKEEPKTDPTPEPEEEKTIEVKVKVSAEALGLDAEDIPTIEVKKDASLKDAVKAALEKGGYKARFDKDDRLIEISKDGLTSDSEPDDKIRISEEARALLEEDRGLVPKERTWKDADSLKEGDFYETSRWRFMDDKGKLISIKDEKDLKGGTKLSLVFALDEDVY